MPLGDSPVDSKPKSPLKKAIAFISPLLVVSAVFHGLAMLLPVPEPEEIVEEDVELPEPIRVSELPELEIAEPAPEPAPVFVPAPVPETPPVVTPPAVVQQPVVQQPAPVAPIEPQPVVEPDPIPPEPLDEEPEQNPDPVEQEPTGPPESSSVPRTYRDVGTGRDQTYAISFAEALAQGVYSDGNPINYKPLDNKTALTISVPAGDSCFPKATPIAGTNSVTLPASLFIVVSQEDASDSEGFIRVIEVGRSTGYDEANDLITSVGLSPEADEAIYLWLKQELGGTFPFATQGADLAYFVFNVEAVYENHSCPSGAV